MIKQSSAIKPNWHLVHHRKWVANSWPLWPAQLFLITILCTYPFTVGDLVITPQRVLLLLVMPLCIGSTFQAGWRNLITADLLIGANALWTFLSFCVNHGLQRAVVSGGIYSVEILCPYLIARLCITDIRRFSAIAKWITWISITLFITNSVECLTSVNLFRVLFGQSQPPVLGRMGVYRAYGPFAHPILNGVFCSSAFGLSWYVVYPRTFWIRFARGMLVLLATASTVASGALLSFFVQLVIIMWDLASPRLPKRWMLFTGLIATAYIAVGMISNRDAASAILSRLAFSPGTAYTRQTIWQYGSAEVLRHPIFGIGLNEWQRPGWLSSSIDNYWLATAMRYGLPGVATIVAVMIWLTVSLMRQKQLQGGRLQSRMAWISVIVGIALAAGTVHIWGAAATYLSFFLGMAGWMIEPGKIKGG